MSESHDYRAAVETRPTIDGDKNAYKQFHRLRAFLVGAVPLGMLYAITALAYGHGQSPVWMWLNLATLGLLIVYLLVAMFRRPRRRPGQAHVTPKWGRVLERFVDDDRWFSIFALLLPVIVLILAFLSDWLRWGGAATWTLTSVGAALYLCYLLMLTFVSGYRAILAVLNARERQLDQARREAAMLRRENELASRTHDTVTGTLSSIILLSEQQRNESRDPAQAKAWNIVNQASAKALDNLHQVIDILGGDTRGDVEGDRRPQTASHADGQHADGQHAENLVWRLNRTTAESDDRLHVLGFPGGACISGTHNGDGGQGGVETERLLRELYANIRDHASPDTRYRIGITLDASQALIVQTNTVAADDTRRKSCSGRGLRLHRKLIRQLGGTLTTTINDTQWGLEACIPLTTTFPQE